MPRRRTKSPVAGLKPVRSKGKLYWYHRATGLRIKNDPNSAAGLLEISALDKRAAAKSSEDRAGSLSEIVKAYQAIDAGRAGRILPFRKLSDRTRQDYQECLDYIEPVAAQLFPADMKPRHVQKIVDDAADDCGWAFGDKLLSVLRLVINWGAYHELTAFEMHPCKEVLAPARDEDADDANRPWTDAERVAVFNEAPLELAIVFGLCLYAQLNIAHALDLPPNAVKVIRDPATGETLRRIRWRRNKNNHPIDVAIEGPLATIIDACPSTGSTLAVNSRGDPWTLSGAQTARKRLMKKLVDAGKVEPGLTFHGLRSTLGAVAAEAGANDKQIAAAIHDGTSEMGALYSRGAERKRLAEAARAPLIELDAKLVGGILTARLATLSEHNSKVVKLKA